MLDDLGNINNVVEVQEYVPENLEGLAGFDPPPSPKSRYTTTQHVSMLLLAGSAVLGEVGISIYAS